MRAYFCNMISFKQNIQYISVCIKQIRCWTIMELWRAARNSSLVFLAQVVNNPSWRGRCYGWRTWELFDRLGVDGWWKWCRVRHSKRDLVELLSVFLCVYVCDDFQEGRETKKLKMFWKEEEEEKDDWLQILTSNLSFFEIVKKENQKKEKKQTKRFQKKSQ